MANDSIKYGTVRVGEHIKALGGWCTQRGHGSSMHPPVLYLALCISSIWLFSSCICYNPVSVYKVFPSSVSHYCQLLNLRRVSWESQFVAKPGKTVGSLGAHIYNCGDRLVGLSL